MFNIVFDKFNQQNDIITLTLLVKSGRRYEKETEYGYSHLLEHMLTLKGSKKFPSQFLSNFEIEKFGGVVSASTNLERNRFILQCESKNFLKALDVFLDNIFNPIFDENIFENEKLVLINENKIRYKNPENILVDKIFSSIFGKSEIFTKEKENLILKTKINSIKNFYQKHYYPENFIFIFSGTNNYIFKKAGDLINSYFKQNFKNNILEKRLPRKINFNSPFNFFYKINSQIYSIFLYYLLPNISLKQTICLDLISNFLGFGQSSLFYQELRFKRGLIYGVFVNTNHKSDISLFLIKTNTSNPKETIEILLNLLNNLKITEKDLNFLKIKTKGLILRLFINPLNKIETIERLWLKNEKQLNLNVYFEILEKITIKDLNEIINLINSSKPIIGILGEKQIYR